MDIWAPGQWIYSAVADETGSSHGFLRGTSMASPAIAGLVANLLWVDPTLTHFDILNVLLSKTVEVSQGECNDFECLQPVYDCDTLPQESLSNGTTVPVPAEVVINASTLVEYELGSPNNDLDCNYVGFLKIDPTATNTDNYNDYAVEELDFHPTDKCLSDRYYGEEISYSFQCISDNAVTLSYWNDSNCNKANDGADAVALKTIYSGQVEDDRWYTVDCTNDDEEELEEDIHDRDGSDCDITYRIWWGSGVDSQCELDKSTADYFDVSLMTDACYWYGNETSQVSYNFRCSAKSIDMYLYEGDSCKVKKLFGIIAGWVENEECIWNGYYLFDITECPGIDMSGTTTTPAPSDVGYSNQPLFAVKFVLLVSIAVSWII